MQCPTCGTEVRTGQKFCMECGQSLRGVADVTGEVPAVAVARTGLTTAPTPVPPAPGATDTTRPLTTVPPPPPAPAWAVDSPPVAEPGPTMVITTAPPPPSPTVTGELPRRDEPERHGVKPERPGFRLRPLLVIAVLAGVAAAVGVISTLVEITTTVTGAPFDTGTWKINDFGTNNTIAALIAVAAMLIGAFAWCFGYRWGAGLAGGGGAALAGWVALLIGLAEVPINRAETAATLAPAVITRDIGYWALAIAGVLGALALLVSLIRAGSDGRSGLDPWVAALAAVAALVAAIGPTIPEGSAEWSGNYSSASLGVDLPAAFFAGRLVQLGLLAFCGVVGFLLVRRYGLGLAVGGAVTAGWMVVTAAIGRTDTPIGPAYENPGSIDLKPHAVTVVGMAVLGFFALVAIVMALLDADR
jgi:zinc ribbon protein